MKRTIALTSLAAGALGALLTVTVADYHALPSTVQAQERVLGMGFAPVVRKAVPAVVNISSTRVIQSGTRNRRPSSPMEEFFGDLFGGRGVPNIPQERRASGLGSGVIVTADGYILTNNHVVEQATEVKVALSDRREFNAKVVGADPQTDIAVLKIDAKNLPVLPVSDSAKVQVGDIALAIGNPFGVGQTVTMGIISATGRQNLGIIEGGYEDFIQTDAAINPGNSGGALINASGQLIAINSAIISGSGGNQGIGFAVPVNMAQDVMNQLVKGGRVVRGYIGAGIQDVTSALARGFGLPESTRGVAITRVEPGAPAERAGLRANDIVIAMNGESVTDGSGFRLRISRTAPGTVVQLRVLRDGKEVTLPVTLGTLPSSGEDEGGAPGAQGGARTPLEGVSVQALTPEISQQLRLPAGVTGVVVTAVEPDSPAAQAGLQRGDLVEQVNRRPVSSVREFESTVRQSGSNSVLLLVRRGQGTAFIVVEPK